MRLFVDYAAIERLGFVTESFDVMKHNDPRRYYVTTPEDERLALVVVRGWRKLADLAGRVMDASVGWDKGTAGLVFYRNRLHTQIAIYDPAIGADYESTLSDVLNGAPRRKE